MSPDSNSGRALHDLNGSTMLSKVDSKWSFHQVLLFQESRDINRFATQQLLYRCVTCLVSHGLSDCEGVVNIADDLVVFSKDTKERDRRLFAVLVILSEVGMTVDGDKCEFGLTVLMFFGHKLSSDGVSPSEEKIVAIIDARLPVTSSFASVGITFSCYQPFLGVCSFHP